MDNPPFTGPVASTSKGIYTLPFDEDAVPESSGKFYEDDEDVTTGRELFEEAWAPCLERIHATLAGLHDECLDQLLAFVARAPEAACGLLAALTGRKPIPTGLIIGASPGSSSLLFSSLCRHLASPPERNNEEDDELDVPQAQSCLVSRIASRECPNIKAATLAIVTGFLGSLAEAPNDADDDQGPVTGAKSSSLPPEDLQNLTAWYASRAIKKSTKNPDATLVILLEDLEGMDAKVLTQLCDVLSHHAQTLPLVLLIGVATAANALDEMLLRRSLDLLEIAPFYVEPGIQTFNALIRGLFIDWDPPLRLGPKAFTGLLNMFTDLHLSIDATISGIKYLYMTHFTSKPYSTLTLVSTEAHRKAPLSLRHTVQNLDSVKTHMSKPVHSTLVKKLTGSESKFLAAVDDCRRACMRWSGDLRVGFALLLSLRDYWKWKDPMENLLQHLVQGTLGDFSTAALCKFILATTDSKLKGCLEYAVKALKAHQETHPGDPTDFLTQFTYYRDDLARLLDGPRGFQRVNLVNMHLPGTEYLYSNKKNPLIPGDKDFSALVLSVSETITSGLRNSFRSSEGLLLHELWFTNEVRELRDHFNPAILPAIHRRLLKADEDTGEEGHHTRLDIAVAYRLYKETGKSINLGDWWTSFDQTAAGESEQAKEKREPMAKKSPRKRSRKWKQKERTPESDEDGDEEDDDGDDEDEDDEEGDEVRRKQARFLRAVGDLAFVGFLQPTSRKAKSEHVTKSVF